MELRVAARLLTLLSVLVAASAATKGDASTIDLLRRELLGLEHDLENDLAEPKWANVELQQKYLHVVRTYKKIDDRLDEAFSPYQKIHLRPLESLWIWTYIQTDCKVIDDLYMVFRQLQSEILEAGAPVNAKPLMNFVEKMMRDSHSVPWAHNRIAHFIVENKLLIGTFQVAEFADGYDPTRPHTLSSYLFVPPPPPPAKRKITERSFPRQVAPFHHLRWQETNNWRIDAGGTS